MKAMEVPEFQVRILKYLVKTYNGVVKLMAASGNRISSLEIAPAKEMDDTWMELNKIKGRLSRQIRKELAAWDVWTRWLEIVPGIGPWLGAELIILLFYKFLPTCKTCGNLVVLAAADLENKPTALDEEEVHQGLWCDHYRKELKGDGVLRHGIPPSRNEVGRWAGGEDHEGMWQYGHHRLKGDRESG